MASDMFGKVQSMDKWKLFAIFMAVIALLSLAALLIQRYKTAAVLKHLLRMLACAMDGTFHEHTFDESLLSALESKWHAYLSSSTVSTEQMLREKECIKTLLADISHQTKTPISNILLYAELLEENMQSKETIECVTALRSQAHKLSFLITHLIKLSRLETGIFTLTPVPAAISPVLDDVVTQFTPNAAQKQIQITSQKTNANAVIDVKWTTEALCNLMDNAIKYTAVGGNMMRLFLQIMFCFLTVVCRRF